VAALGIWLALLVHEAGHLAGGISRGFRFLDRAVEIGRDLPPVLRSLAASEAAWLRAALLRAQGDLAAARAEAEAGLAALGKTRFGKASARDRELLEPSPPGESHPRRGATAAGGTAAGTPSR
jgi:hypothetical protein